MHRKVLAGVAAAALSSLGIAGANRKPVRAWAGVPGSMSVYPPP